MTNHLDSMANAGKCTFVSSAVDPRLDLKSPCGDPAVAMFHTNDKLWYGPLGKETEERVRTFIAMSEWITAWLACEKHFEQEKSGYSTQLWIITRLKNDH